MPPKRNQRGIVLVMFMLVAMALGSLLFTVFVADISRSRSEISGADAALSNKQEAALIARDYYRQNANPNAANFLSNLQTILDDKLGRRAFTASVAPTTGTFQLRFPPAIVTVRYTDILIAESTLSFNVDPPERISGEPIQRNAIIAAQDQIIEVANNLRNIATAIRTQGTADDRTTNPYAASILSDGMPNLNNLNLIGSDGITSFGTTIQFRAAPETISIPHPPPLSPTQITISQDSVYGGVIFVDIPTVSPTITLYEAMLRQ